ncbi:MAG: trigger factor [Verrucomicrobiota bacterium]
MNVTVENLAPCRKLVRVEVDANAVDTAFGEVTGSFLRQVKLPGFRPGKAPRAMVERTYSKEIEDEVKRKLINENYRKAVEQQKIHPVGYPDIEEIQFGRGQPMLFAATLETEPEFELPEYKGLPVKKAPAIVSDADVDKALNVLREQRAGYEDVARPVQPGDFVVVNYSGTSEGKPLTEFAPTARGLTQNNNFWLHVEAGSFIPGFTEQLVGASAGEKRTVEVQFPADFVAPQLAGKQAVYEVEIVQVKVKALPALDDEFGKSFGTENLEKLREGVRKDLQAEANMKQRRDVRNQLVGGLLSRVNFELPESIVLQETRNVVYDVVRENQERGIPKEAIEKQKNEIYNYASNSAKERVKVAFLLSRIAEKEGVKVEQKEIMQRILFLAQQYNIPPHKMVKQLQERNGIAEIHEQIQSAKVLDLLEQHAQVEEVPPPA